MKIALHFDMRNPPGWRQDPTRLYGFTLEMCEEAERLGADAVWISEHHMFEDEYVTQPLAYLAAVAARTKRVRLGTAILMAPIRPAPLIAEEATLIDVLSGGRMDLGLGAGYRASEFELYGADVKKRYSATDNCAREIRRLWNEGILTPRPVQARPPIWMGYLGPKSAHRAGLLGEGLLNAEARMFEPYRQGLIDGGHDPAIARMQGMFLGFCSEDPDADWPVVKKHVSYHIDSYMRQMFEGTGQPIPPPVDPEKLRRTEPVGGGLDYFVHATPEEMAAKIRTFTAGAPVETVCLWASIVGMPEKMVAQQIHTICTKLRPLLA
jgi:alkanesulfonate monooxygenase SsuD/methylene tetrahydromethanopterin reductase-like flavin-dependent oxidoreductase (luciferase family)